MLICECGPATLMISSKIITYKKLQNNMKANKKEEIIKMPLDQEEEKVFQ